MIGECEDGICSKEVSDLEDPICMELQVAGGDEKVCVYFNEET